VDALCVARDTLFAGGSFGWAGNSIVYNVASWDGASWRSLGGGTDGTVYALTAYQGDLAVGGDFAGRLARWNGASWQAFVGSAAGDVWELATFDGALVAGGDFTYIDGVYMNYVGLYDGMAWHPLSTGLYGQQR